MHPLVPKQDITWSNNAELFFLSGKEMAQFPIRGELGNVVFSEDRFKAILNGDGGQTGITCRQSFCRYLMISITNLVNIVGNNLSNSLIKDKDYFANGSVTMGLYSGTASDAFANPKITIELFDIIVGNTLVILDQKNPDAVRERRKKTGFAGDAICSSNSLTYKVPTNFWLRHPITCSLFTGLMRTATNMSSVNRKIDGYDYLSAFKDLVSRDDIVAAINNNDAVLARKNFDKISKLLAEICTNYDVISSCENAFPITKASLPFFNEFLNQGLDYWFKNDIWANWKDYMYGGKFGQGIEKFLLETVKDEMSDRKNSLKKLNFDEIWIDKVEKSIIIPELIMAA